MKVDPDGRVVVVTGAASGIGRTVAQAAAEAGAALFLTDRVAAGVATRASVLAGGSTTGTGCSPSMPGRRSS